MQVEGKGLMAPAPVKIVLAPWELRMLEARAQERERAHGYAASPYPWRRGLTKNAVLVGMAGEYGLQHFLTAKGLRPFVDMTLKPHGDGGHDLEILGLTCQVKTRRGHYPSFFVRRGRRDGRILPLLCDVLVFAQWRESQPECVNLCGWQWPWTVTRECGFERSPHEHAGHWNLAVPDTLLYPMCRFLHELSTRQ